MATKTKLKPCPHCGSEDIIVDLYDYQEFLESYIYCNKCGAATGMCANITEAKRKWNRRTESKK